ncbi:MAG TPA: phosphate acyltransferase, partial [Gemmatimonadales bacterium]|nr:phosphate acyltransferase [Gemmatimonadales bacterium]
ADCTVNIDPDAETLAEIASAAAQFVQRLGIEPRVALLSFSNFGSVRHAAAARASRCARRATACATRCTTPC